MHFSLKRLQHVIMMTFGFWTFCQPCGSLCRQPSRRVIQGKILSSSLMRTRVPMKFVKENDKSRERPNPKCWPGRSSKTVVSSNRTSSILYTYHWYQDHCGSPALAQDTGCDTLVPSFGCYTTSQGQECANVQYLQAKASRLICFHLFSKNDDIIISHPPHILTAWPSARTIQLPFWQQSMTWDITQPPLLWLLPQLELRRCQGQLHHHPGLWRAIRLETRQPTLWCQLPIFDGRHTNMCIYRYMHLLMYIYIYLRVYTYNKYTNIGTLINIYIYMYISKFVYIYILWEYWNVYINICYVMYIYIYMLDFRYMYIWTQIMIIHNNTWSSHCNWELWSKPTL